MLPSPNSDRYRPKGPLQSFAALCKVEVKCNPYMSLNPPKVPSPPKKKLHCQICDAEEEKRDMGLCFIFGLFRSLMIEQRVRAPQNEFDENSEKYDDWILPWLIQAVFVLANRQLFAIDRCDNDAIRLNGDIIKLKCIVWPGSLAKLSKRIMGYQWMEHLPVLSLHTKLSFQHLCVVLACSTGMFSRFMRYVRVLES